MIIITPALLEGNLDGFPIEIIKNMVNEFYDQDFTDKMVIESLYDFKNLPIAIAMAHVCAKGFK